MRASLLLAAVLALRPSVAAAQQQPAEQQQTHTVKKKDTLWDLAQTYLNDPFQWPEIYRINREVVEDPHWIYPGEVLKIPGKVAAGEQIAEATPDSAAAADNATEPAADSVREPLRDAAPVDPNSPTIFTQQGQARPTRPARRETVSTVPLDAIEAPVNTVRFGEFLAAPFVDQRGGPRGSGHLLERADLSPVSGAERQDLFQLHDRILIRPPVGSVAPEGERYISYTFGPYIEKVGQVVIPTGVVQVTRPPRRGEAAVARVVRIFNEVRSSNRLMPYDSAALAVTARPQPVTDGRWAKVQWVANEPVMASLQNYVVLNITSKEGVQLGDEFQLFQPRRSSEYPGGLAKPEIAVARAQVVKVTPFATTILITGQEQPVIDRSTMARISAKMP